MFLPMLGLAILGILGIAAVLFSGIMLTVEGPREPPLFVQWLVGLCGAIAVTAAWYGLWKYNSRWHSELSAEYDSHPEKILTHWIIPDETWKQFRQAENERARTNLRTNSLVTGGMIALIVLIPFWISSGFVEAVAWSAGLGLFIAFMFCVVQFLVTSSQNHWRSKQHSVEVWLRADGMKINDRPITWSQFGSSLESIRLHHPEGTNYGILETVVNQATHRRTIQQEHRVPVPRELCEQVESVVSQCR